MEPLVNGRHDQHLVDTILLEDEVYFKLWNKRLPNVKLQQKDGRVFALLSYKNEDYDKLLLNYIEIYTASNDVLISRKKIATICVGREDSLNIEYDINIT